MTRTPTPENPFLAPWTAPDGVPPFDHIKPEDFRFAYERAFAEHEAEVAAIAAAPAPAIFGNTIAAMERSGRALTRVQNVFHVLVGDHSNEALLELEREMAPHTARHWNKIHTNAALFSRIDALAQQAGALGLTAEQQRV